MDKLINQLKTYFGDKAIDIKFIGKAEINVILKQDQNIAQLSNDLQTHIIQLVEDDALAKINLLDENGNLIDSFALNQ